MKATNFHLQLRWIVKIKNVMVERQFRGCFKQEVQMNQQHNSLDVQNAKQLGEITHKAIRFNFSICDQKVIWFSQQRQIEQMNGRQ